LCRIVDTIEDDPALGQTQKRYFCELFAEVTKGAAPAHDFSMALYPLLSDATLEAERNLVKHTPDVIKILNSFTVAQRNALTQCIDVMSVGMAEFQQRISINGLHNIDALNRYCYYVAGVVGEMLTRLFCDHSPAIAERNDQLMKLAVSFGQGLQMTNILKDVWDDLNHGACWLPQDVFRQAGFDLHDLSPGHYQKEFGAGLEQLITIASEHLEKALCYTLLIPKQETGIRNFCLWAIGMAVLTLRKINQHRDFSTGNEVKISKRSVKATVLTSRLTASHNHILRGLFLISQIGQPGWTSIRNI
jgi:farnesyl-diphosphate farnesyltransferase